MKATSAPFNGTKEQEKQLIDVINELRNEPGCLMPIMQKAQDIYGYLPLGAFLLTLDDLVRTDRILSCQCHDRHTSYLHSPLILQKGSKGF